MGDFVIYTRQDIDPLISRRPGETKFGERVVTIETGDWEKELKESKGKFVLIGIPEDIGVRANFGVGGAHTAWMPALKAILNVQDTKLLHGENLIVLGAFDFTEQMNQAQEADIDALRELVGFIDDTVHPLIEKVVNAGKVPIVIGGGHNNCFPILKGASEAKGIAVNCINLDAHSDYRIMEGRHSGNGFRYAHREGFLNKYEIIGLHENYNSEDVIEELTDDPDIHYCNYEEIFLREKISFYEAVEKAIDRTAGRPTGIELDIDCIERVLSSAATPSGISVLCARQYIHWCASETNALYLHLTEGATELRDGRTDAYTPKLIAYLVTDFIKAYRKK